MRVAFFDTHKFEKDTFLRAQESSGILIDFFETRLNSKTAQLAQGYDAVCCFVNDKVDSSCLVELKRLGIRLIALRSAGFNNVNIAEAGRLGIQVCRVPGYSPHGVAEFTIGLLLSLNRKIHRAHMRVREQNFSLEGLVGFNLVDKTVGIIGAGKIGQIVAQVMASFGCRVLVNDIHKDSALLENRAITYTDVETICSQADIISLHVPLTSQTRHLINQKMMDRMKHGVLLINTGRGALIDSKALIGGLKSGKIGGAALDVYEEEEEFFFQDLSSRVIQDDILARLLSFPNVLITSHQAFLTQEALDNIANTTIESFSEFERTGHVSAGKSVITEQSGLSEIAAEKKIATVITK